MPKNPTNYNQRQNIYLRLSATSAPTCAGIPPSAFKLPISRIIKLSSLLPYTSYTFPLTMTSQPSQFSRSSGIQRKVMNRPRLEQGYVPKTTFKGIARTKVHDIVLAVHKHKLGRKAIEDIEINRAHMLTREVTSQYISFSIEELPRWSNIGDDQKMRMIRTLESKCPWMVAFQDHWAAKTFLGKHINSKADDIKAKRRRQQDLSSPLEAIPSMHLVSGAIHGHEEIGSSDEGWDDDEFNGFSDDGHDNGNPVDGGGKSPMELNVTCG